MRCKLTNDIFSCHQVDKGTLEFEEALLEDLLNFVSTANANTSAIQTYVNVARSFDDLANEAIGADIPRIVGGVLIVYTYVLVMLGGFVCVQQKLNYNQFLM